MQPSYPTSVAFTLAISPVAFTLAEKDVYNLLVISGEHDRRIRIMNSKHLTLDDRIKISQMLSEQKSFKSIAASIGKNCTSVSREIRNHMVFRKTGGYGRVYNACIHRRDCTARRLCTDCSLTDRKRCSLCDKCNSSCPDFKEEKCLRLNRPPYVCNGCPDRNKCTLEKHMYDAASADREYKETLSESRTGISYSEEEIAHLDHFLSPLIRKGQSINHICANNKDSIMVSERTVYRLVDYNLFSARNLDLPRKVKYSRRKKKKDFKVDKACRANRTYRHYLEFCASHPGLPVTEMDSVEGTKGGKVLLTLHFVKTELMLAFLRDSNDSQSVIDIIDKLYLELRRDIFISLMPLVLTDNGSEFSNPRAMEFDRQGNRRTHIFYCDPSSPGQKGSAEKNHEFIRYVLPKGTSFDGLTQADISLLMDHINSYSRESLGNKCPYDMFQFLYGEEILSLLGCHKIRPNDVNLTPALLRRQ